MDEKGIMRISQIVTSSDIKYCLGDFFETIKSRSENQLKFFLTFQEIYTILDHYEKTI